MIYMDNHATTRVDPRVVEVMLPFLGENYGNAGSVTHGFGRAAREAVDAARAAIALAIGAQPRQIVFTSGATESNNLAIRGVVERNRGKRQHVVSVTTEHPSVLGPLEWARAQGCDVTLLPVRQAGDAAAGRIDPQQVADALRDDTTLVTVMLANNEIGVLQPIAEVAAICRGRGVPLHTDATQGVGKLPVDVDQLGVDLMSFSAHKVYGPKGIGALFVRRPSPVQLPPLLVGGGQERGLRSGTLNVAGIVGFAKAMELCGNELAGSGCATGSASACTLPVDAPRVRVMRDDLYRKLCERISGVTLNGPALDRPELRLAGNLNVSFALVDAESLLLHIEELAVSTGAACSSANPEPSHVLKALGLSDERIRGSVRFGLGRFNNAEEVNHAVDLLAEAVDRLRKFSSA